MTSFKQRSQDDASVTGSSGLEERIPLDLQPVFIKSARGEEVNEPPVSGSAFKVFKHRPILKTRIPFELQQVFLASSRGEEVHEPPPSGSAFKQFTRKWFPGKGAKKSVNYANGSEKSSSGLSFGTRRRSLQFGKNATFEFCKDKPPSARETRSVFLSPVILPSSSDDESSSGSAFASQEEDNVSISSLSDSPVRRRRFFSRSSKKPSTPKSCRWSASTRDQGIKSPKKPTRVSTYDSVAPPPKPHNGYHYADTIFSEFDLFNSFSDAEETPKTPVEVVSPSKSITEHESILSELELFSSFSSLEEHLPSPDRLVPPRRLPSDREVSSEDSPDSAFQASAKDRPLKLPSRSSNSLREMVAQFPPSPPLSGIVVEQ